MEMSRLIHDTRIKCPVKLVAGNTTGTATMESEEDNTAFVSCIVILRRRLCTRYRSVWSRDWLLRRQQHSAYYTLLQELDREAASEYAYYLRINKETFDMFLKNIKPCAFIYNVADMTDFDGSLISDH